MMKKIIFLLVVLLNCSLLHAQTKTNAESKYLVGVQAVQENATGDERVHVWSLNVLRRRSVTTNLGPLSVGKQDTPE